MNKKCAECGDSFSCDNDIACWCMDFPKLSKNEIDDRDCLCKTCLLIKYRKKILNVWNELRPGTLVPRWSSQVMNLRTILTIHNDTDNDI